MRRDPFKPGSVTDGPPVSISFGLGNEPVDNNLKKSDGSEEFGSQSYDGILSGTDDIWTEPEPKRQGRQGKDSIKKKKTKATSPPPIDALYNIANPFALNAATRDADNLAAAASQGQRIQKLLENTAFILQQVMPRLSRPVHISSVLFTAHLTAYQHLTCCSHLAACAGRKGQSRAGSSERARTPTQRGLHNHQRLTCATLLV